MSEHIDDKIEREEAPRCKACGSKDILFDAYAEYDTENQMFTVVNVMDGGHQCQDCEGECKVEWA